MARIGGDGAGLVLRLAVGTVLIWAGLGTSCHDMPVQGEKAAILANLGVIAGPATGPATTPPPDEAPEETPLEPAAEDESPTTVKGPASADAHFIRVAAATPAVPTTAPKPAPKAATPPAVAKRYTAADYPDPVDIVRWRGLVLVMYEGQINASGRRIVPESIATNGRFLTYLAGGASWIALIGGLALLLGAMTRLAALLAAGVSGGAMWLSEIGPALGSRDAILGMIPDPHLGDPALAPTAWAGLLLHLLLFASVLALAMMGGGRLSLDHWFWGDKPPPGNEYNDDDDDDDE